MMPLFIRWKQLNLSFLSLTKSWFPCIYPLDASKQHCNITMDHQQRMKSVRTANWTSARSPATTVGKALERHAAGEIGEFAELEKGIAVTKVTSRGRLKPRIITISRDRFALFLTHQKMGRGKGVLSKVARKLPLPLITRKGIMGFTNRQDLREKFVRYVDVADLDFIQFGCVGTLKLESARTINRLKGMDSKIDEERDKIVTIGHSGNRTIDLLVENEKERQLLVMCLQRMLAAYQTIRVAVSNEALLLRYIWYDVDVDQTGAISEIEFLKILTRINFTVKNPLKSYRESLKKEGGKDELTYSQVMTLLQELKNSGGKSMANSIWDKVFGEQEEWVSPHVFLDKFVRTQQGETHASKDDVERLFSFLNLMETNIDNEPRVANRSLSISRQRFEVYLHHQLNNAYDPWSLEGMEDLDAPMSQYWINTSHNTYLTGDQLQSFSSVEMYMKSLRRGCKCLELDCWDGEKDENGTCLPIVYHGLTLTSKILFADIIRVVDCYVDQNPSTLPIILSLENHCSHPFQKQMAADMEAILGDKLYVPKETDHNIHLPSPASLRGKVVIKGKRPPDPDDAPIDDETEPDEDDPYAAMSPKSSYPPKEGIAKKTKPPKVVKELANLTLFHGTKYKEFNKSIAEPCSHMHSISEPKILKIVNKTPSNSKQWREYNQSHMSRTYPAGARVDSSNYNPILAWALGCQLVALNFQTTDTPLILNDGLFAQNGRCGYVLKPDSVLLRTSSPEDEMRSDAKENISKQTEPAPKKDASEDDALASVLKSFNEVMGSPHADFQSSLRSVGGVRISNRARIFQAARKGDVSPQSISIRVLSGSCLPKPMGAKRGETIDPYVVVTVHDVKEKADGSLMYVSSSHTTSTVQDNGFCPKWNETKATEFVVHSPEVAVIHFSLIEEDIGLDDKVGDAAIPVSCLRKGYRSIQLFDRNATRSGPFAYASVLVHIEQNEKSN